ncbi:hypothetical protein JMJ77_0011518, partial [Colletotrichum scovillei]
MLLPEGRKANGVSTQ